MTICRYYFVLYDRKYGLQISYSPQCYLFPLKLLSIWVVVFIYMFVANKCQMNLSNKGFARAAWGKQSTWFVWLINYSRIFRNDENLMLNNQKWEWILKVTENDKCKVFYPLTFWKQFRILMSGPYYGPVNGHFFHSFQDALTAAMIHFWNRDCNSAIFIPHWKLQLPLGT